MTIIRTLLVCALGIFLGHNLTSQCNDLYIQGVIDGPLSGGTPKAIQLCANTNIPDLSIYGLETANNGGTANGEEYTFPADAINSGDCIWVTSTATQFNTWFGFDACYTSGSVDGNGNDTYILYCSGSIADLMGEVGVNGTGTAWEYLDGWASATDAVPNSTFDAMEWTFSGIDALDGESDNASATTPYPNTNINCPAMTPTVSIDDISMAEGDAGTTTFTFTVTLSAIDAADVTFDINTADGTATIADNDYVAISGGMGTITAGMTTTTIDVTVNGDMVDEGSEDFDVVLSNLSANATFGDATGTGTIQNDDAPAITCPSEGDVIITEIMNNPAAVSNGNGEYFELYNTTGVDIDINGWAISDNGADAHIINNGGPLNIPAGSYLVLSNNADDMTNGGVTVDYEYSSFLLSNTDDEIILTCDPSGTPTEIDRVEYDGGPNFPDPTGASMNLNPNNLNSVDNDTGANWCESTSALSGGDMGTPGLANDACSAPLPTVSIDDVAMSEGDAGTTTFTFTVTLSAIDAADVTFDVNTADGTATIADNDYVAITGGMGTITAGMTTTTIDVTVNGDMVDEIDEEFDVILSNISVNATFSDATGAGTIQNDDAVAVTCPNEGDVIVTEIMNNPSAVLDASGEYFELYNITGADIDIDGWEISDNGTDAHIINNGGPLIVPAGSYIILGNNSDDMTNGGVTVDYEYSSFTLANSDDEIILTCDPSGTPAEIDKVEYDDGPNFPDPTGASMNLDPGNLNYLDNDIGANWCESTSALSGGDLGTPGAANDACSVSLPTLSIDDVAMSEGDAGTTTFTFTVTLSAIDAADVTFDINTADGTATTADNDYVAISGASGTITAGMTTTTIDVTVNGDINVESDETFDVLLSNISANATFSDATGTGTILNDDVIMVSCPNAGDIVITEIMKDPFAVADADGEYFEIYNMTGADIDIEGWEISDNGSDSHIINSGGPLNVPAGSYFVLGVNSDDMANGGVTVDYEYSAINFSNGSDEIVLTCDPSGTPTEIDRVEFDDGINFPDPTGASMNLNPFNINSVDNDTGANWCESSTVLSGGDLGTPGTTNDACTASLPTVSINDVLMAEGNAGTTTFTFTVTLSEIDAADVTFDINTSDGSATTADNDYVAVNSVMGIITAGNTSTTIDITVNGDMTEEMDETFDVLLSNISANATFSDATGLGTIQNDDSACPAMFNLTGTESGVADYETSGSITSDQTILSGASVDYDATTEITLNPPFEIQIGAIFEAFIDGCDNGGGGSN